MTKTNHDDTFAALNDIAELLEGAWDKKSDDNYIVRGFMIATGTLLEHGRELGTNLAEARETLKSLFTDNTLVSFGMSDPLAAVVNINALVDGAWSELSEDNYLVQAFILSTELMLEKGALLPNGSIVRRCEDMKSTFSSAPSI
jgi:hypothetical protein